jgi:hypothetical protein
MGESAPVEAAPAPASEAPVIVEAATQVDVLAAWSPEEIAASLAFIREQTAQGNALNVAKYNHLAKSANLRGVNASQFAAIKARL